MPTPIAASTIAAQAFRLMEIAPISSFGDDSSQAADAREQYVPARNLCLELYDWSFARVLAHLPEVVSSGDPLDPDLPHVYELPSSCLAIRLVTDPDIRWRRDGQNIRADRGGTLPLRYTGVVEDEARLPATFQTAVSYQLAVRLAPRWVGSRTKRAQLSDDFLRAVEAAKQTDARSASPHEADAGPARIDWALAATR